jgi:predicted dehydrogenase
MVQIAVIGAGDWGKNHIRTFAQLPDSKLVAVCDLDQNRLKYVQANYPQVKATTQINDIMNDKAIEAVVIASSAVAHYSLTKMALLAGKDVLVEKPLTLKASESEELIQLADKNKRILMVGHLLLYHSAVEMIKKYIQSGELGDIYYVYTQRVNLGKIRHDENALWSFAPHDFSVILHLFGEEPESVAAQGFTYLQKNIQDLVFVNLSFRNHRMAHVHISWLDPHKIRRLTIVGSKKMLVFDDVESTDKIKIYDKGAEKQAAYENYAEYISLRFGDVTIPYLKLNEPLRNESAHFIDCVKTRKTPLTDGKEGLKVVKLLESAQKSMEQGGIPVKI